MTSWPRTLLRIDGIRAGNQPGRSGNTPRSPPLTPLRPPFRGGSRDRRRPEHPAAELAGAAVPVPGRDGRPDQRLTRRCRRAAGLRRRADPPLGKRRSPLAVTAVYRRALKELTGLDPAQLGFIPNGQDGGATGPHRRRRRVPQRSRARRHLGPGAHGHRLRPRPGNARHAPGGRRAAVPRLSQRLRGRTAGAHQAAAQLHLPAAARDGSPWPSTASCWSPSAGSRCCSAASTTTSASASKPRPPGRPPTRQACKPGTARSSPGPTRWPPGSP